MKALTTEGRRKVIDIADRYNLQPATVEALLTAIIQGNGTMAQFNIAELGGQGQWMKGGMTMVGDMFNSSLRATVEKLCSELSELVTTTVLFEERETPSRGESAERGTLGSTPVDTIADHSVSPWPAVFGNPTSSGSQNNFRYAYFGHVHRLVIEENGRRTIYDTKHHQITGISQQQGAASSYRFTSEDGPVELSSLEKIADPEKAQQPTPEILYDITANADLRTQDKSPEDIILATIEKLNLLFEKGQISEGEFNEKKKELLERL
ncbi:MAG: SHOCT domain-containing protein [Dyadobacter fermentans]